MLVLLIIMLLLLQGAVFGCCWSKGDKVDVADFCQKKENNVEPVGHTVDHVGIVFQ